MLGSCRQADSAALGLIGKHRSTLAIGYLTRAQNVGVRFINREGHAKPSLPGAKCLRSVVGITAVQNMWIKAGGNCTECLSSDHTLKAFLTLQLIHFKVTQDSEAPGYNNCLALETR